MSLLNDLLNDLAKQGKHKQTIFTLTPVPYQHSFSFIKQTLFTLFFLSFLLFAGLVCSKIAEKSNPKIRNLQLVESMVPSSSIPSIKPKPTPLKSSVMISYIEPLALPTTPPKDEVLEEWPNDEELFEDASPRITKIDSPQTLQEWHEASLNKALKAIDQGFDDKAIHILKGILKKIPKANDARESLASLYLAYGNYASAAKLLNEGLHYSPRNAALLTMKARLYLDKGESKAAIHLLSSYKPSLKRHPDFYATMAAALQAEGDIIKAGALYKALLQVEPHNGQYWLGYAISLEHGNQAQQAKGAYLRASQDLDAEKLVRDYAEDRLKLLQG